MKTLSLFVLFFITALIILSFYKENFKNFLDNFKNFLENFDDFF